MNKRFKYRTDLVYPEMESETLPNGKRTYYTPDGPATSVTTILSTLPHPELDRWRERVGEAEAFRVSKEATDMGTCMHNRLEAYVKDEEYIDTGIKEEEFAKKMFQIVKTTGLSRVNEIWGVEEALYCHSLYAGRTDLIGVYNHIPSIIDYKTSKFFKKAEYIYNYKLQTAAYCIAHDEMFGDTGIRQGVLLIGTRPNPEYRIPAKLQRVIIPEEEMKEYKIKWMDIVEEFHKEAA